MNNAVKIKICLVLYTPWPGGTERVVINIANNLDCKIFDTSIIFFNSAEGEFLKLIKPDIKIHDLKFNWQDMNRLANISKVIALVRKLREIKTDIIFSSGYYANLLCCAARVLSGIKSRLIIRETSLMITRLKNDLRFRTTIVAFQIFYPFADIFLAPSQSILDDFVKDVHISPQKSRVIPNFVDNRAIDNFLSLKHSDNLIIHKNKPAVISVGRLEKIKGYEYALQAFRIISNKTPCEYWIVGSGPLLAQLKELANNLSIAQDVRFLGFQNNPYTLFKQADIYLLSSELEGFPNSVLEAMYCGLPCVVTRYNSTVNQVIDNNLSGLIVEPKNPLAIAEGILTLLNNPNKRQEIGLNGRKKAQEFNVTKIIKQYEELFQAS